MALQVVLMYLEGVREDTRYKEGLLGEERADRPIFDSNAIKADRASHKTDEGQARLEGWASKHEN